MANNAMTTLIRIEYTDTSNENRPVIKYDVLTTAASVEEFKNLAHAAVAEWRSPTYKESFTDASEQVFFDFAPDDDADEEDWKAYFEDQSVNFQSVLEYMPEQLMRKHGFINATDKRKVKVSLKLELETEYGDEV